MGRGKDDDEILDISEIRKDDRALDMAGKGWEEENAEELDDLVRIKQIVEGDEELW